MTSDFTFTFWYSICWSTKDIRFRLKNQCKSVKASFSSGVELTGLKPSTTYFVEVARLNCNRKTGDHDQKRAITRAAALQRSGSVSHNNFKICFGTPQDDDSYVQIVVLKLAVNRPPGRDPDSYQASDLKAYDANSRGHVPYVAAEVSKSYIRGNPQFTVGDGKSYSQSSTRKRRSTSSSFLNAKLDPGAYYSVFQRTFKSGSQGLYYNSEWSDFVKTLDLVTVSPPPDTTAGSDSQSTTSGANAGGTPKGGPRGDHGDDGGGGGTAAVGAAAGVGGVLIITLLVLLIVIIRRRRRTTRSSSDSYDQPVMYKPPSSSVDGADEGQAIQEVPGSLDETGPVVNSFQVASNVLYAKPVKTKNKKPPADQSEVYANLQDGNFNEEEGINASRFIIYVQDMKKNKNFGFEREFKELPEGQMFPWDVAKKFINKEKNRYGNIVTYDHSRVILSGGENKDYINASFVKGVDPDNYIASQGPTDKTVSDFWRMIWEQNSNCIIALTNAVELGKVKCVRYWPDSQGRSFGEIHVKTLNTELFADYVIRHMTMAKDGKKKKVTQYHFTSWPDHGVPKYPTQILAYRRRFKALHTAGPEPIVVHCSAGVGRTGTFIALDIILERLDRLGQNTINVFETIKEMRTQRVNMIQTLEQYIFVHDAILESVLCGFTEIEAANIRTEVDRLEQKELDKPLTGFEIEFRKLNSVCLPLSPEECEVALKSENKSKNRVSDIYPAENLRVVLSRSGGDPSPYINATYVHGYTQPHAFIATQAPLPNTINDFWKMAFEKKASVIVMLNNLDEGQEVYPQYWPNEVDRETQYGELFVKMVSCETYAPIISRKFSIISKHNLSAQHMVRHVQFTDWPENGIPSSESGVMTFLDTVEEAQQRSANGVVVVHCSNGAHRTGTYLALAIQRERVRSEHVIDVFRCIKMLRGQRPQFVGNVEQYQFCYRALLCFVELFQTYDNIPKTIRE